MYMTVANLLTRVDMETDVDKTASQLTLYAIELLTRTLTQPASDIQSQGVLTDYFQ